MHSVGGIRLVILFGEETGTHPMPKILSVTLFQRGTKLIHGNLVGLKTKLFVMFNFVSLNLILACVATGNELSGKGIGASVGAAQYGKDLIKLKEILHTLYKNSTFKPSLVAPGGFYNKEWFDKLLQVTGPGIVNVLTHHVYNLGPGLPVTYLILSTIVNLREYFTF